MRFASPLALVFLALFAGSAGAAERSITVSRGGVTATIRGDAESREPRIGILRGVKDLTVKVESAGAVAFDGALPACRPDCGESFGGTAAELRIRDLDGDGTQEVLVDRFISGDICCSDSTTVVALLGGAWTALRPVRFGSAADLKDMDGDGDPDLVGDDPRFFTRFAPRVLGVFLPLRVHRYEGNGVFADITMALRPQLRAQRKEFLSYLPGTPKGVTRAALPSIAALDHLLGEHGRAARRFSAAVRAGRISSAMAGRMKRFLKRSGYCAGCAAPATIDAKIP